MARYEILSDMLSFGKKGATIAGDDVPAEINVDALIASGHLSEVTTTPPKSKPNNSTSGGD